LHCSAILLQKIASVNQPLGKHDQPKFRDDILKTQDILLLVLS
jgi:hypothetical protein